MLRHIDTKERWNGERIDGIAHPKNIEQLWTDAELAAVGLERYEKPKPKPKPIDPLTIPLSGVQFHAMLRMTGKRDAVLAAINGMPDGIEKAVAQEKLERSWEFERNDPLLAQLAPAVGLTDKDIDSLWVQALEVK